MDKLPGSPWDRYRGELPPAPLTPWKGRQGSELAWLMALLALIASAAAVLLTVYLLRR